MSDPKFIFQLQFFFKNKLFRNYKYKGVDKFYLLLGFLFLNKNRKFASAPKFPQRKIFQGV